MCSPSSTLTVPRLQSVAVPGVPLGELVAGGVDRGQPPPGCTAWLTGLDVTAWAPDHLHGPLQGDANRGLVRGASHRGPGWVGPGSSTNSTYGLGLPTAA